MDTTFLLIKPSAVAAGNVGGIISSIEGAGFKLAALAMKTLSREEAERFYDVHVGKEFYEPLLDYMTSGPTVGLLLRADDAVSKLRRTVGVTDPAQAEAGTIRALYGKTVRQNAVHASDSTERMVYEARIYFGDLAGELE